MAVGCFFFLVFSLSMSVAIYDFHEISLTFHNLKYSIYKLNTAIAAETILILPLQTKNQDYHNYLII
jgi:hypothetical protein